MTQDLMQFLRARLDEDELWATEASRRGTGEAVPGGVHWQWENNETDEVIVPDPGVDEFVGDGMAVSLRSRETWPTESGVGDLPQFAIPYAEEMPAAVGAYIARNDPARVLREVEAKRRIMKAHERLPDGAFCATCDAPSGIPGEPYGCATLRLLALPYADHPDYREEWRP